MNYKFKKLANELVLNALKIFWIIPIKKKEILFASFDGAQYSDSPKYIYEYLSENYPNLRLRYIWAFNNPQDFNDIKGVEKVKTGTFKFLFKELTSKVIVINDSLNTYIPIRKSQIVLNTWHGGGAIKRFGLASPETTNYDRFFFEIHNKKYTVFSSDSLIGEKKILNEGFGYYGNVLRYGLPRNAILQVDNQDIKGKVRGSLKINESSLVILYAPTFRGNASDAKFNSSSLCPDFSVIIPAFEKRFCKDVRVLFRGHHSFKNELSIDNAIDVTHYHDMQELLIAADILITDYSSCMWDMAVARKPVFLYTPDIEIYSHNPGFFTDYNRWPYIICKSTDEFKRNIKGYDQDKYLNNVEHYLVNMGSYESKDSLKKTCEWIVSNIKRK